MQINTELIKKYIKDNQLTMSKFCKLSKISPSVFKKMMKNKTNFRIISLFKVAKLIKLELYQMFI